MYNQYTFEDEIPKNVPWRIWFRYYTNHGTLFSEGQRVLTYTKRGNAIRVAKADDSPFVKEIVVCRVYPWLDNGDLHPDAIVVQRKRNVGRFVIRVFKAKYGFDNYDDSLYRELEREVEVKDPRVREERFANDEKSLLKQWKSMLRLYEGYTYVVKDLCAPDNQEHILTGGVFDPSDDEYIQEYFH